MDKKLIISTIAILTLGSFVIAKEDNNEVSNVTAVEVDSAAGLPTLHEDFAYHMPFVRAVQKVDTVTSSVMGEQVKPVSIQPVVEPTPVTANVETVEQDAVKNDVKKQEDTKKEVKKEVKEQEVVKVAKKEAPEKEPVKPESVEREGFKVYDIPLTKSEQKLLWDECQKQGVEYELAIAIMRTESDFRKDLVSKTNDYGIMQMNADTAKWLVTIDDSLPKSYDLTDYKTNIKFALSELRYLEERWEDSGLSKGKKEFYTVVGYNRGYAGSKRWVRNHGFNNDYYDKVMGHKNKLEEEGGC